MVQYTEPMVLKPITDLKKNPRFVKYFGNTAYLLIDKIFNLGVAFFVSVYVARYLGPTDFGILNFAQSVVAFAGVFASFGIRSILVRNLVNSTEAERPIVLGTAFSIRLGASLIGVGAIVGLSFFITEDQTTRLVIGILSLTTLFESLEVVKSYFQSKVLAKKIVPVAIIQTITGGLLKVLLVRIAAPLEWFAAVYVIEMMVSAVGLALVYHRAGLQLFRWRFNLNYSKELIKDAWPLLFSGFVIVVYMRIDQIMIKYLLNNHSVGVYAVSVKLTSVWYFVGTIICSSLMPALIQAKKISEQLYHDRQQALYEFMIGIGLGIAVPLTLVAYPLVQWLFGDEYAGASSVLIIQTWSLVFIFLGTAGSNWLIAENLQRHSLTRTLWGAIANVLLNFLLIPLAGIQGAAIATLVSQLVASYLGYGISQETRVVFVMQSRAFLFSMFRKQLKKLWLNQP